MEYFKELTEEALSDAGIKATSEQIDTVSSWVKSGFECHHESTGQHMIADPREEEVKKLKTQIDDSEKRHDRTRMGVMRSVASRRGVDVKDVSIEADGSIYVRA